MLQFIHHKTWQRLVLNLALLLCLGGAGVKSATSAPWAEEYFGKRVPAETMPHIAGENHLRCFALSHLVREYEPGSALVSCKVCLTVEGIAPCVYPVLVACESRGRVCNRGPPV